jgi:hypothetical protein
MTKRAGSAVKASGDKKARGVPPTSWATSIVQKAEELHKAGTHPALWVAERMGDPNNLTYHNAVGDFVTHWLAMFGSSTKMLSPDDVKFPTVSTPEPLSIPLNALLLQLPPSGAPYWVDWYAHLAPMLATSFESRREPLDVKPIDAKFYGRKLACGSLVINKGVLRAGASLFQVSLCLEFETAWLNPTCKM